MQYREILAEAKEGDIEEGEEELEEVKSKKKPRHSSDGQMTANEEEPEVEDVRLEKEVQDQNEACNQAFTRWVGACLSLLPCAHPQARRSFSVSSLVSRRPRLQGL